MKVNSISTYVTTEKMAAELLHHLDWHTTRYATSFRDGWRAVLDYVTFSDDGEITDFALDATSDIGGGDYAPTKLNMLRLFPDLPATGIEDIPRFVERLKSIDWLKTEEDRDWLLKIIDKLKYLEDTGQINRAGAEALRSLGLTHYRGAIRVPATIFNVESDNDRVTSDHAEIRIAFSGGEEWQDTYIACSLLKDFLRCYRKAYPGSHIAIDLSALRADPELEMWLDLVEIEER